MSGPQPVNHPNAIAGQLRIDPTDTTRFGVYSTGTVKKHPYGLRYRVGDRVFKYIRGGAALQPRKGGHNMGAFSGVTGGNVTARAIGDVWVDILLDGTTGGTAWFGTKNEMVGGMWVQPDTTNLQFRMITGHEKGANGGIIKVYLDGPITRTMIATSFMEIAQNPYRNLQHAGNNFTSVFGVPTTVIASGSYGWGQTWGPCVLNPNTPVADTASWRTVCFRNDGSISGFDDIIGETGHQVAGFVIDNTSPGSDNPPFIFLQISPF
ncbi:hypothetical protein LCGC14_0376850 [marine sediment metagenome]|uniref:Uncharacterized protein n=1 Tax=marine sediment metagenome TaxID=412755 RepID=A0A0F9T9G2_9ZZZZ